MEWTEVRRAAQSPTAGAPVGEELDWAEGESTGLLQKLEETLLPYPNPASD